MGRGFERKEPEKKGQKFRACEWRTATEGLKRIIPVGALLEYKLIFKFFLFGPTALEETPHLSNLCCPGSQIALGRTESGQSLC